MRGNNVTVWMIHLLWTVTKVCCFCSFTFNTVRLSASALMLWFILTAAAERKKTKHKKRKIHCLVPRHQGTSQWHRVEWGGGFICCKYFPDTEILGKTTLKCCCILPPKGGSMSLALFGYLRSSIHRYHFQMLCDGRQK